VDKKKNETKGLRYRSCIYRPEDRGPERRIYLADYVDCGEEGRRELRALSDRRLLYCEDCGGHMVLYWATTDPRRQPHFQHLRAPGPEHPVRPPKSPLHVNGQTFLRRLLRQQLAGATVEEEQCLPGGQRADVFAGLAAISSGALPDLDIEIQCSPEPALELRTAHLEANGIRVRWMFGIRSLDRLQNRRPPRKMEEAAAAHWPPPPGTPGPGPRMYITFDDRGQIVLVREDADHEYRVLQDPVLDPAAGTFYHMRWESLRKLGGSLEPPGFSRGESSVVPHA
jgi:hypothetical protein